MRCARRFRAGERRASFEAVTRGSLGVFARQLGLERRRLRQGPRRWYRPGRSRSVYVTIWAWFLPALADETAVVVARRDLPRWHRITAEDVLLVDGPLPEDFGLRAVDGAVDRIVLEPVFAHEILREERLADPESGPGIQALVPMGRRASRIAVRPGSVVAQGDYVDVLSTRNGRTTTLVEAAWVVGIHEDDLTVVTSPHDALKLMFDPTALDITLRNPLSVTRAADDGADPGFDLGGDGPVVWVAAADLVPGDPIGREDLVEAHLGTPSGSWVTADQAVGRVPVERILRGEPIHPKRLADPARPGATAIPPELRGLTLDAPPPTARVLRDGLILVSPREAEQLVQQARGRK